VAYLLRLARLGVGETLISFEKPERFADRARREALRERLAQAGITWRPLRYHRRPRLPATLWDVLSGARAVRAAVRASGAALVHCRGDVAMAMARAAGVRGRARLVYEARGLFADERVEVGSWTQGGALDRLVRRFERGNLRAADGLLSVMAPYGLEALARRHAPLPPHRSLPNSVDLEAFTPRARDAAAEFGLAYHGSLGGWYLTREMVAFARAAQAHVPGRALFVTPQPELARAAGATPDWAEVVRAEPHEVPGFLRRARASFFLIQPSPAKRASSPTKLAEALACGLPVAANAAAGDLDPLLEAERVGVLVRALDGPGFLDAAERLARLLADPQAGARCRALAESRYSLARAVEAYHALYRELVPA
jgi:glycosyltransferase involved in cell wall biosynthesis